MRKQDPTTSKSRRQEIASAVFFKGGCPAPHVGRWRRHAQGGFAARAQIDINKDNFKKANW
jgi:hypothetical protein